MHDAVGGFLIQFKINASSQPDAKHGCRDGQQCNSQRKLVQDPGDSIDDEPEHVLEGKDKTHICPELVPVGYESVQVSQKQHVDAEQSGKETGGDGNQPHNDGVVFSLHGGVHFAGHHLNAQSDDENTQQRLDDPLTSHFQKQASRDDADHDADGDGERQSGDKILPILVGYVEIDKHVHRENPGRDLHIIDAHGHDGVGDQRVAESHKPFDDVAQKLGDKDKNCQVCCHFHTNLHSAVLWLTAQ